MQGALYTAGKSRGRRVRYAAVPRRGRRRTACRVSHASGLPVTFGNNWPVRPETRPVHLALKRALDIVLGLLVLVSLAPGLLAIAATVRLTSKGPILFRQSREGRHGRPFVVYKFRTMRFDMCDATGRDQTAADDPRLTPVGRFLRQTNADELPQLFNVLRGDMSLIGPRPHVPEMRAGGMRYDVLVPYYGARHAVKPGISGWAQANGLRGPTDDAGRARARIDHDLAYIQNFSLLLDLKVIWLTIRREISGGTGI